MGDFSLDLPRTEEIKKEVEKELAPTNEDKELIDNTMKEKADMIMGVDLDSLAERREFVQVIETFGADIIKKSSVKNSILQKRMGGFQQGRRGKQVRFHVVWLIFP